MQYATEENLTDLALKRWEGMSFTAPARDYAIAREACARIVREVDLKETSG